MTESPTDAAPADLPAAHARCKIKDPHGFLDTRIGDAQYAIARLLADILLTLRDIDDSVHNATNAAADDIIKTIQDYAP